MSGSLAQFITEIGDIEKRLDQYIAEGNVPIQLPTLPSIPSIPSIGTTFRPPAPPSHRLSSSNTNPEADRLSSILLSVKHDIHEFLISGDLGRFFKYAKNNPSELEFVETTLRLISNRYSVWSHPQLSDITLPSSSPISSLHTCVAAPSSSRRVYSSTEIRDKIKQVRNHKRYSRKDF